MSVRYVGLCVGGPYDGKDWVYFSKEMEVLRQDDGEPSFKVMGIYKHYDGGIYKHYDGKWIWHEANG